MFFHRRMPIIYFCIKQVSSTIPGNTGHDDPLTPKQEKSFDNIAKFQLNYTNKKKKKRFQRVIVQEIEAM